ncbi:hypothetical protein [Hymenobacter negativus]|uniref:Outer membrane protein beta-barrel domain-containing protein n=1 Tax=Hymenobacter negativus TaxID=2795026 RepID=A0ABS3QA97_9BACT|nr:hypothetical protein [Hymenobacter negativus]MBO2008173.1 hypothetical protein [Hymenobacter negativus]
MTDREPDDLYDALRDRLADYGQEPPAPLWAGIRAQLPPPVAQPQLRPKRRRASVVLLLLLLATASGVGWHWWQQPKNSGSANSPLAILTSKNAELSNQKSALAHSQAERERAITPASSASAQPTAPDETLSPGLAGTSTAAGSVPSTGRSNEVSAGNSGVATGSPIARNGAAASVASAAAGAKMASKAVVAGALIDGSKPLAVRRTPKRQAHEPATDGATVATISGGTAARQGQGLNQHSLGNEVAANLSKKPGTTSPWTAAKTAAATRQSAARRAPGASIAATALSRQSAKRQPLTGPTARDIAARSAAARVQSATGQPAAAAPAASVDGVPEATVKSFSSTGLATASGPDWLQARAVALQLAAGPALPQPQAATVAPNEPPASVRPRWAVQVLAGPALTYRQLSSPASGGIGTTSPSSSPGTSFSSRTSSTTSVAELERPALGSGFQVNVRRSLTERWTLSAGLGYAEYATRLALQQVHVTTRVGSVANTAPSQDSATTSIHRRDTYRFVTLPLRVGYARPLTPRWSVGLLAGADVAVYIGGSSTEGSTCACQTQSWGLTGSPYRRVSVGASLGAEVRYRLNGRWELLAQPTATYMLTPLAQSTTAYSRRHLLGGTALLGASYTLP